MSEKKEKINIFISHTGKDEKNIEPFKKLLSKDYDVRDSSIIETEPNRAKDKEYIKNQILKPQIDWAGTVVVLIGKDTKESDWVKWEAEYANMQGKRVVSVYTEGASDSDLSEEIKDLSDSIASWNRESIINAINGDNIQQDSSGNTIQRNNSNRINC